MKVFEYDLTTGKRGELLGNIGLCHGHGAATVKLINGAEYSFLETESATDLHGRPITAKSFNKKAICFCLGKFQCGSEPAIWQWVVSKA